MNMKKEYDISCIEIVHINIANSVLSESNTNQDDEWLPDIKV